MKKIILLVWGIVAMSCTKPKHGLRISVLEDVTESDFMVTPDYKDIIKIFRLDQYMWQSAEFRYTTITDVNYNTQVSFTLEGEKQLLGNAINRKKEVDAFLVQIKTSLSKTKDSVSKTYSSIWRPLLREIAYLQEDSITPTTIYVFSDLRENTPTWSSYHPQDTKVLQQDFDAVARLFLVDAKDISRQGHNIEVVVIYQPQSIAEDMAYQKMTGLYTSLFKSLNIPITFTANL